MDKESILAALPPGSSSMDVDSILAKLCPGYKFRPTDSDIIDYLKRETESRNHPIIWRVHRVFFRDYKPQELAEKYQAAQDNKWYFVSYGPLHVNFDVNLNHKGWKITHKHTPMEKRVYEDGQLVGYTAKFEFLDENYHETEGLMRLYAINDPSRVNKLSKWMLCKMYKDDNDDDDDEEEELEEYASSTDDGEKYDQET